MAAASGALVPYGGAGAVPGTTRRVPISTGGRSADTWGGAAETDSASRRRGRSTLSATRSMIANAGTDYKSEYAETKGFMTVYDHETGAPLVLNTKTAFDRAMERGDATLKGAETNSSVIHALPKLSSSPVKSAALLMFTEKQRQDLVKAADREVKRERERRKALSVEPMQWRRIKMRKDYTLERVEAYTSLEKLRTDQEEVLLVKARELGLL